MVSSWQSYTDRLGPVLSECYLHFHKVKPSRWDKTDIFKQLAPLLHVDHCCKNMHANPAYGQFSCYIRHAEIMICQDIEKLRNACMKIALENYNLQIHTVAMSNCAMVAGLSKNITSDDIEFYFDTQRKSGVSGVRGVKLNPGEETCLVFFEDPQSALDVCKREHKIKDTKLAVRVYYECLGQAAVDYDGPKFKPLSPITIENVNARKLEFLVSSKQSKLTLERKMDSLYAEIYWPDKQNSSIEIRCTLTEDVKDCRRLGKTWAKSVISEVEKFLDLFVVEEIEVLTDVWDDVIKQMQTNIQSQEGVDVRHEKGDKKIVIVGCINIVKDAKSKVKDLVQNVEMQFERRKQSVTKEMPMKVFEIRILMLSRFIDALKQEYNDLQIHLDEKGLKIIFYGISSQITKAQIKVYEKVKNIVCVNAGNFSSEFLTFLSLPDVESYVVQEMKAQNTVGAWVTENDVTWMYSFSNEEAVKAITIVKESVIETNIPLDITQYTILNRPECKTEIKRIEEDFQKAKLQIINKDSQKVVLYQTSEGDERIVKEEVKSIFVKYAMQDVIIPISTGQSRLLREQYKQELKNLDGNCLLNHTQFTIENTRVNIRGSLTGTSFAKREFDNMIEKIYKTNHTIRKAGIVKYMSREQGREKLSHVERKNRVVIEIEHNGDPSMNARHLEETGCFTTPTGQVISTLVGDITELKVDVVVNAANTKLSHNTGLAKHIVEKGGTDIQTECYDHMQRRGKSEKMLGEIYCSSSGKLPCKMIAHAVGPTWGDGRQKEDMYLTECIQATLEEMDKKGYESVAIPALFTGIFGFPVDKATKTIVESIRDYLQDKGKHTKISKIYLCDIKEYTVKSFLNALENVFGKTKSTKKSRAAAKSSSNESTKGVEMSGASPATTNIRVTVVIGQMATQEVDVIVNTTSCSLDLNNGTVSASLLKLGGPSLQIECNKKYPNGIQCGEVATTSGGKLKCSLICHGALPQWNKSTPMVMEDFITSCLQKAHDQGFVSVAFPALGTGNLKYPENEVAKIMFSCIEKFSTSHAGGSVCDVRFVVYKGNTTAIEAFKEEQRKRLRGYSVYQATRAGPLTKKHSGSKQRKYKNVQTLVGIPASTTIKVTVITGQISKQKVYPASAKYNYGSRLCKENRELRFKLRKKTKECEKSCIKKPLPGVDATMQCNTLRAHINNLENQVYKLTDHADKLDENNNEGDNEEKQINFRYENEKGKPYNEQMRKLIYEFLSRKIGYEHISPLIRAVLQLVNYSVADLPSVTTASKMNHEMGIVAKNQIDVELKNEQDLTMYRDATTKGGKHFYGVNFTTSDGKSFISGLREVSDGKAETYVKHTKTMIKDISSNYSILNRTSNTMTDRCAAEGKVNKLLVSDSDLEIDKLNEFKCAVHPVLQMAEVCEKEINILEKSVDLDHEHNNKNDGKTLMLLRFVSKLFFKDGSGDPLYARAYLKTKGIKDLPVKDFRGNRFNVLFHNAAGTFYLSNLLIQYFETSKTSLNITQAYILKGLKNSSIMAICRALGILSKIITEPYLEKAAKEDTTALSMGSVYIRLIEMLEQNMR